MQSRCGGVCGYANVHCILIAKIKRQAANINVKKGSLHTVNSKIAKNIWNGKYQGCDFGDAAHYN